MITIDVIEKLYRADDNVSQVHNKEINFLISDLNLYEDFIDSDEKGEDYFNDDISIKFYEVNSDSDSIEDNEIVDCLIEFAEQSKDQLLEWFKSIEIGKHQLLTEWEIDTEIGAKYLIYEGVKQIV